MAFRRIVRMFFCSRRLFIPKSRLQVIVREFFRPRARQACTQIALGFGWIGCRALPSSARKFVLGIKERRGLAVARQRDVAGVPVKVLARQHIGAIYGRALGFVDGRGVAVIEVLIVLGLDCDAGFVLAVQAHLQRAAADPLDGAEGAVFDP